MSDQELACADKLAFDSEKEAKAAATFAKWSHSTNLKVYKCIDCGLWHLSSSE